MSENTIDTLIGLGLVGGGFIYIAIAVLIVIASILAIFIPFFIFKIRNQTISINDKLSTIIELMELEGEPQHFIEGEENATN